MSYRTITPKTAGAGPRIALAFLAAFLTQQMLWPGPCAAAQGSRFIVPGNTLTLPPKSRPPEIREVVRGGIVILRSEESFGPPWAISKEMSRACSRGQFKQRSDRKYVAVFERRVYGAAVGGHGSLIDKARLAEPRVIYVFEGQGTTDCHVYHRIR